jgi:hypothetical protein
MDAMSPERARHGDRAGDASRRSRVMKPRILGTSVLLATIGGSAAILWVQRQETARLQSEVELAKLEMR